MIKEELTKMIIEINDAYEWYAEEEIRTPVRTNPHEISSLAQFQAVPPRQKTNTGNKPLL